MKNIMKFILFPVIICTGIFAFYFLSRAFEIHSTEKNIELIKNHMNPAGNITDYYGEINMNSVDDIKLFVDQEYITIEFGSVLLKWKTEDFWKPEVLKGLEEIWISCFIEEETNKLKIFYKEEQIERWVS